jgi:mannosylglucosylglycerate synthase
MRDAGAPVALLVTGAGDPHNPASALYRSHLLEERARLALGEHVHFLAEAFPVGAGELACLYRLSDALIFPSRQEGFGLPLLEAALHRLPAFVSRIEPLVSLAPGNVHFLALDESAAAIAERIRDVLEHDPATQARKCVLKEYAWPAIYSRHLAPLFSGG